MQRAPGINLPRVLMEAQDQFFAADVVTVSRQVAHGTSLYLRAGPGLLIGEAISGITPSKMEFWYARARTWISDSMVRPDQIPIAPATGDSPSQLTLMTALVLRGPQPEDSAA
jgi:hypothetical protein